MIRYKGQMGYFAMHSTSIVASVVNYLDKGVYNTTLSRAQIICDSS